MDQLIAGLLHRIADPCADLDLRAQEFGADLIAQSLLAFGEQLRRLLMREVAAVLVDQEVFLLDTDREAWFLDRHERYRAIFASVEVTDYVKRFVAGNLRQYRPRWRGPYR